MNHPSEIFWKLLPSKYPKKITFYCIFKVLFFSKNGSITKTSMQPGSSSPPAFGHNLPLSATLYENKTLLYYRFVQNKKDEEDKNGMR